MTEQELAKVIETFIDALPAQRRIYPDLYAADLAKTIFEIEEAGHARLS